MSPATTTPSGRSIAKASWRPPPNYQRSPPSSKNDLRNIETRYLTQGSGFWVAESGDGLVGITGIQRIDAETARLRRMRVTTSSRRKGVAQRLLDTAEHFCRHQGYRRIILDSEEKQSAAHRLYERAGFARTGERILGPFRVFDYEKQLA
ncbi:MAG TPA: GNAT family N-acetyltransferase [Dehalococcoidia bacterium]|jgi:putative acetyltransferase|nr:GNAT family N-acetyltransferase [Dehalococcoidia bacterium]